MELVSLAGELLQSAAEHVASYRVGQSALRYLDRALWVVEKCARWAVPPPLDQDERPQPELVRPIPWIFFLALLIILRVTRESISLVNLVMGKPPLRSADVVIFIQGRRRYLRTLKYQGNRMMRARTSTAHPHEPWYQRLHSLFEFTMCFRNSRQYGNNNTTSVSNNDEVLVVKRSKRREDPPPVPSGSVECTMERLIEKMMVDLDADSDEDSSFAITNVTSVKSDRSECTIESDQDATLHNDTQNSEPATPKTSTTDTSTTETATTETPTTGTPTTETSTTETSTTETPTTDNDTTFSPNKNGSSTPDKTESPAKENNVGKPQEVSPKYESLNFIQYEISHNVQRTPKKEKIANGRTVKSVPSKNKGNQNERREKNVSIARIASGNSSF